MKAVSMDARRSRLVAGALSAMVALAAGVPCMAASAPPAGSYGFDSLQPGTAKCAKLDAPQIARLSQCSFAKSNSFGDDREGWSCHVGKRAGFMAYAKKADCEAELELERANGD